MRRVWTQSRRLELGKSRWPGARTDEVPAAGAVRSRLRRHSEDPTPQTEAGGSPHKVPAALTDTASQTIPLPRRLREDVQAFVPPTPPRPRFPPADPYLSARRLSPQPRGRPDSGSLPRRATRPPASPRPGSQSSARRHRGYRLRALPRPPPRPAGAHWSVRAAPPASPNQSPDSRPALEGPRLGAASEGPFLQPRSWALSHTPTPGCVLSGVR